MFCIRNETNGIGCVTTGFEKSGGTRRGKVKAVVIFRRLRC